MQTRGDYSGKRAAQAARRPRVMGGDDRTRLAGPHPKRLVEMELSGALEAPLVERGTFSSIMRCWSCIILASFGEAVSGVYCAGALQA